MMARDTNILDTVTIKISTNPSVEKCLEQLVKKGLYGKNISEAAERLVAQKINELTKSQDIQKIKPK